MIAGRVSLINLGAVIFARILDSVALSTLTSLNHPSNDVRHPDANVSIANEAVHSGYINVKSDDLSATLEKLYVWEKKLYKEVKVFHFNNRFHVHCCFY